MSKDILYKSPIAGRLRLARQRSGLSQKQLGIKAGIDEFTSSARINQYEKDKHVPDYKTTKRLAKALDIPVIYLYCEEDALAEVIIKYVQMSQKKRKLLAKFVQEL